MSLHTNASRFSRFAARFGITTLGPFSTAGANFLLGFSLIPAATPFEYGYFSFGMVLVQLTNSVTNAMAATPISIQLNQHNEDGWRYYWPIFNVNLVVSVLSVFATVLVGTMFGISPLVVSLFAFFALVSGVRWFTRSVYLALHDARSAAISDLIYSGVVVLGLAVLVILHQIGLATCVLLIGMAMSLALAVLALRRKEYVANLPPWSAGLSEYKQIWLSQSRWALLGVIATETTGNAHSYLVTLFAGPQAYAPLAVANLCWRPMATLFTSLTLVERPVMARAMSAGHLTAARKAVATFRLTAIMAALFNGAALAVGFVLFGGKLQESGYEIEHVFLAVVIWFAVVLFRTVRVPESVFVQSAREFRELSSISLKAAPISLALAMLLLIFWGPVASIFGIVVGEAAMLLGVVGLSKKVSLHAAAQ